MIECCASRELNRAHNLLTIIDIVHLEPFTLSTIGEHISIEEDSGASMGSIEVTIKDGRTKQVNTLLIDQNFSSVNHTLDVPKWVTHHNFRLDILGAELGYPHKENATPALVWLLATEITAIENDTCDQQLLYPVLWNKQKLWKDEPSSYSVLLNPSIGEVKATALKGKDVLTWLLFDEGNIVRRFSRRRGAGASTHYDVDSAMRDTVIATNHGVYVKYNKGNFSWVFICDDHIEEEHGILRHGGVQRVKIKDGKVVISYQSNGLINYLYVADYMKGIIKRTNTSLLGIDSIDDFILQDQKLVIKSGDAQIELSI